ncbi:MAG: hypothetical protein LBN21_08195, partial [Treponema sp.]|nr:hypothetical protein [Treponema sp.]
GWNIYWYNSAGALLYLVQLKNSAIPVPPAWPDVTSSIDAIMAAPDSRQLFLKVDYYRSTFDESTNTRTGNEPDSSVIWIMNVEDGSYSGRVDLPFFEYTVNENGRNTHLRVLYSMLAVVKNGRVFLYFPVEGGYSLLMLDSYSAGGDGQRRGFIQVKDEELQFNEFDVSAEGILSAFLVNEAQVKLVWWRTDKLIGELP